MNTNEQKMWCAQRARIAADALCETHGINDMTEARVLEDSARETALLIVAELGNIPDIWYEHERGTGYLKMSARGRYGQTITATIKVTVSRDGDVCVQD